MEKRRWTKGNYLMKKIMYLSNHNLYLTLHSYTDEQITSSIDAVLGMMDMDHDGYISYIEYKQSGVEENRKSDYPDGK